jgi:hypothetical protein
VGAMKDKKMVSLVACSMKEEEYLMGVNNQNILKNMIRKI